MLIHCLLSRSPPPKGNVLLTVTSPWNSPGEHILLHVRGGLQWQCWHRATHCQRTMKGYHSIVSWGEHSLQYHHSISVVFPKQRHQCQRDGQAKGRADNQWLQPSRPLLHSATAVAIASRWDTPPPFQHCSTSHHCWRWSHPFSDSAQPQPQSLPRSRRSCTNATNVTA
jgi:hypothetical protein